MQAQEDFLKIKMCGECDFCLFVVEKNGQFHFSVLLFGKCLCTHQKSVKEVNKSLKKLVSAIYI